MPDFAIAVVTGASSGIGAATTRRLATEGYHVVAVARREERLHALAAEVAEAGGEITPVTADITSDADVARLAATVAGIDGDLELLVNNAGGALGSDPIESASVEDWQWMYDVNVLGTQRVNRAALPHMRKARRGLVVWIGSSSAAGGVPPMLGPYFAAKAGMDALAVCYARELAPFGIETSIVVPGAFTKGTNHFAHAGAPADKVRAADYEAGLPAGFGEAMLKALAATVPETADPERVADTVVGVVNAPFGTRPFRVVVDPADDGSAVAYAVIDRVRAEFLHRVGFADLMHPKEFGVS